MLSTEFIPPSQYHAETHAIFNPGSLSGLKKKKKKKRIPLERQIWLKYTFRLGWWVPRRFCRRVSVRMLSWWWKGGSEMNPGSVPDMPPSFLLPWWNPLSSGMAAGSKLLQTRHRHEGGRVKWDETFKPGNIQSREVVLGEEKFYHVIMKQWQFFHFHKQPVADGFRRVISSSLDIKGKEIKHVAMSFRLLCKVVQ